MSVTNLLHIFEKCLSIEWQKAGPQTIRQTDRQMVGPFLFPRIMSTNKNPGSNSRPKRRDREREEEENTLVSWAGAAEMDEIRNKKWGGKVYLEDETSLQRMLRNEMEPKKGWTPCYGSRQQECWVMAGMIIKLASVSSGACSSRLLYYS